MPPKRQNTGTIPKPNLVPVTINESIGQDYEAPEFQGTGMVAHSPPRNPRRLPQEEGVHLLDQMSTHLGAGALFTSAPTTNIVAPPAYATSEQLFTLSQSFTPSTVIATSLSMTNTTVTPANKQPRVSVVTGFPFPKTPASVRPDALNGSLADNINTHFTSTSTDSVSQFFGTAPHMSPVRSYLPAQDLLQLMEKFHIQTFSTLLITDRRLRSIDGPMSPYFSVGLRLISEHPTGVLDLASVLNTFYYKTTSTPNPLQVTFSPLSLKRIILKKVDFLTDLTM